MRSDNMFQQFNTRLSVPRYNKTITSSFSISEESRKGLENLANIYTGGNISALMEAIGLYVLSLDPNPTQTKTIEDYTLTTQDMRDAGYEDALQNNPNRFNTPSDFLEQQYVRGYYEGMFTKKKSKR